MTEPGLDSPEPAAPELVTPEPAAPELVTPEPAAPPRPRRRLKRVLLWVGGVLAALVIIALVLYDFGGPSGVTEDVRTQYATLVAAGRAPAIDDRFTVPIPGCRCHSDDPVVIMQHSERRIRDCFGCH